MPWTKKSAIKELNELIAETHLIAKQGRTSPEFMRWYLRCVSFLEEVFGGASKYSVFFKTLKFQASGQFFLQGWDLDQELRQRNQQGFIDDLNRCVGIFQGAIDELKRKPLAELYQGKNTPKESSMLVKIVSLAERKLRKVIRAVPKLEKDIQNAFEDLLIGADIQYQRENPHIAYSSKNYIPDFSFPKIDLALDVKLCANPAREKQIIAEMNDDIMAYKTKFGNVAFVIYDVGMIRDVDRFTTEFSNRDDVLITVVKH